MVSISNFQSIKVSTDDGMVHEKKYSWIPGLIIIILPLHFLYIEYYNRSFSLSSIEHNSGVIVSTPLKIVVYKSRFRLGVLLALPISPVCFPFPRRVLPFVLLQASVFQRLLTHFALSPPTSYAASQRSRRSRHEKPVSFRLRLPSERWPVA